MVSARQVTNDCGLWVAFRDMENIAFDNTVGSEAACEHIVADL
jgi:hypothetical protein